MQMTRWKRITEACHESLDMGEITYMEFRGLIGVIDAYISISDVKTIKRTSPLYYPELIQSTFLSNFPRFQCSAGNENDACQVGPNINKRPERVRKSPLPVPKISKSETTNKLEVPENIFSSQIN